MINIIIIPRYMGSIDNIADTELAVTEGGIKGCDLDSLAKVGSLRILGTKLLILQTSIHFMHQLHKATTIIWADHPVLWCLSGPCTHVAGPGATRRWAVCSACTEGTSLFEFGHAVLAIGHKLWNKHTQGKVLLVNGLLEILCYKVHYLPVERLVLLNRRVYCEIRFETAVRHVNVGSNVLFVQLAFEMEMPLDSAQLGHEHFGAVPLDQGVEVGGLVQTEFQCPFGVVRSQSRGFIK